jgi:hypothetical protein
MPSDFEEVARFSNPLEARQALIVLSHNGLNAYIEGENANSTLWYVGTAIGGVKLLVEAGDKSRALEILNEPVGRDEAMDAPWRCEKCFAEVDAGFDVCWRCDNDRNADSKIVADGERLTEDDNQQVGMHVQTAPAKTSANQTDEAEATIERAWRAAVLGALILPFLAQVYSLVLLGQAFESAAPVTSRGKRLAIATLVVDVIALVCHSLLIRLLFGWSPLSNN